MGTFATSITETVSQRLYHRDCITETVSQRLYHRDCITETVSPGIQPQQPVNVTADICTRLQMPSPFNRSTK
ncbi:hypothetical protein DPMN_156418 [Dreissena polymorpha]|uniref:Uncharacterized protein n=1 Tax=Dreissena polymorpha TaxID=45954 RepID=A0A9D4FT58_DREPO|nr:hypothetical protein DPMN_156418 [Dreissena polymorpha]